MLKGRIIVVIVVVGLAAVALGMVVLWGAGWIQQPGLRQGELFDYGSGTPPRWDGSRLIVMSWNIAYARGTNPDNEQDAAFSKGEIDDRLEQMGATIRQSGADLVLLQEIDFDSQRSCGIDQLARLAEASGLRYGARAISWRANYVPFPYWPPSRHYGGVLSGGAVLSRFPLRENRVRLHPKPRANPWWYNLFYLFRYTQSVRVDLGDREMWAVNNHLEAWDKPNRVAQARALVGTLEGLRREGATLLLFAGDLNTVPPEAKQKHGFVDSPRDDYRGDETLSILRAFAETQEIVPMGRYVSDETRHFTFPTLAPTRRLDYVFVDRQLRVERYHMLRTGDFSDHLPVVAEIRLRNDTEKLEGGADHEQ
jgi:endonuclease/exonuclease/phosphatase family metal-dependent hydrolase